MAFGKKTEEENKVKTKKCKNKRSIFLDMYIEFLHHLLLSIGLN